MYLRTISPIAISSPYETRLVLLQNASLPLSKIAHQHNITYGHCSTKHIIIIYTHTFARVLFTLNSTVDDIDYFSSHYT